MSSRFERDLADFHALEAPPRPVFEAEVMVRRQPMSRARERSVRLVVGVLGLFWAIVLALVLIGALVVGASLVWGAVA